MLYILGYRRISTHTPFSACLSTRPRGSPNIIRNNRVIRSVAPPAVLHRTQQATFRNEPQLPQGVVRVNAERPVPSVMFNSMGRLCHGSVSRLSKLSVEIAFMTVLARSMKWARDYTGPCTTHTECSPKTVCSRLTV